MRPLLNERQAAELRAAYLAREPLCVDCLERGERVPATEVEHVVPLGEGGAPFASDNLAAYCKNSHSRKTAREVNARWRQK
jgi:5-methylcytosine-specific restriction protein A